MLTTLTIVVGLMGVVTSPTTQDCDAWAATQGLCSAFDDSGVTIGGSQTVGGGDGSAGSPGNGGTPIPTPTPTPTMPVSTTPTDPGPPPPPLYRCDELDLVIGFVYECIEDTDGDEGPPAVTISDVARFVPDGATVVVEPDGVGIVNLPTNLYAEAQTQTISGAILGWPVQVRFTPASFEFHHGDGTSAHTATAGHSWASMGLAQFTPTDTSHIYRGRGTFVVRVDTHYSAAVNFGEGWEGLSGEVTARGPEENIRVYEARTLLVADTCRENAVSPGC